ncbi:MAG: PilZ domain-containing protein [Acidobacteria bacterium]|nr:PilZ domain-containing protein [Acidobacteriota bacterium]
MQEARLEELAVPEKRRYLRVPLLVRQLRVKDDRGAFFGYATNLSTSGIFVQTFHLKAIGSRLQLLFTLPGDTSAIACMAEVVWVRDYDLKGHKNPGVGLRFVELSAEVACRINQFVGFIEPVVSN